MNLRLAKRSDIRSLAQIHLECSKIQPDGFMYQLGFPFLKTYYKILLEEKKSIILVAENKNGLVLGFCSGSLAAEEHLNELKNNRIKLAILLIPSILKSPNIFKRIIDRNKYINSHGKSLSFGIFQGPRIEYWAWRPDRKDPIMALRMMKGWLSIVFKLGHSSIKAEVDIANKDILKIHKLLGAKIIQEINLPDGRKRVFIEYTKI